MTVLMLTADLMFSSRVNGAAATQDVEARFVASTDALVESTAEIEDLRMVILDLTTAGCDPSTIVAELRHRQTPPIIVAYAPHIQVARLDQARAAGCDRVLTRGQFDNSINTLLASVR